MKKIPIIQNLKHIDRMEKNKSNNNNINIRGINHAMNSLVEERSLLREGTFCFIWIDSFICN